MKFNEIDKQGTVDGFALVKSCDMKTAKNGSNYLDIVLADADEEMAAKLWDYREGVSPKVEANTVVRVRGVVQQYNNQPQMKIERIRPTGPADNVKIEDFVPAVEYSGEFMMGEIQKIVESFQDIPLKTLIKAVLDEYGPRMLDCPAAFRLHHAVRGGLLYHTLSILRLAEALCKIYPTVDRDLLFAGAILHDMAKVEEFELSPLGLVEKYTPEGALVGHLVLGAIAVNRIGTELGTPKETLTLLEHMLVSHHGQPEFGAAVRPLFLEAEILSQLDLLDARIHEIERVTGEVIPGEFSNRVWSLDDRKLYNHGRKIITREANLSGNK